MLTKQQRVDHKTACQILLSHTMVELNCSIQELFHTACSYQEDYEYGDSQYFLTKWLHKKILEDFIFDFCLDIVKPQMKGKIVPIVKRRKAKQR